MSRTVDTPRRTGETKDVVSTREAPPLSASAGRAGFVPSAPQLFRPSRFIYRPRASVQSVLKNDSEAMFRQLQFEQLDRRLTHQYGSFRAALILHNVDRAASADLSAWTRLGS